METNHSQTMLYYREPEPMLTAHDKLFEVLSTRRGERHLIVLHAYPDPDAISSAYAHRLLSAHCGIATDMVYCGTISHGQNIALIRLLKLYLTPYRPGFDLKPYAGAVYVDNQGTNCGALDEALRAANVPTVIVVDHHEAQGRLQPGNLLDTAAIDSGEQGPALERSGVKVPKVPGAVGDKVDVRNAPCLGDPPAFCAGRRVRRRETGG